MIFIIEGEYFREKGSAHRAFEFFQTNAFNHSEGQLQQQIATARSMVAEGLDKEVICRVLKVTPEELERLID